MFEMDRAHHLSRAASEHRAVEGPMITAVIVHWKNADDTAECLESLSRVEYPNLAVCLVNNNSDDLDETRFRQAFPRIHIIDSHQNLGLTGGNNLGIRKALEDGANFILLLNPDTVVRENLIHSLLPHFDDPDVAVVGPVITYYDFPDRVWFAGGDYSRTLGYTRHPLMGTNVKTLGMHDGTARQVTWINTCAMVVRGEVFGRVGLFCEEFFIFFDEVEFCLRVGEAKLKCLLVEEGLVLHKVSASIGKRGSNEFTADKAYYFGRNSLVLVWKRARTVWKVTGILSQFLVVLPYWIGQCARAGRPGVMRDYVAGMIDGVRGRTGRRQ
jgi:GT2 family glycosyltransferase